MESLISIALIGLIAGIVSNLLPYFGSTLLNFIIAVVVMGIYQGLQLINIHPMGLWLNLFIFAQWYFIGTFAPKLLQFLPIPILQPIAQTFAGEPL